MTDQQFFQIKYGVEHLSDEVQTKDSKELIAACITGMLFWGVDRVEAAMKRTYIESDNLIQIINIGLSKLQNLER